MASGYGAGGGADMLQEILKRKLVEQAQMAQQQQHAASLAEAARRANMTNALGHRQVDENSRQFNENAPMRIAGVRHHDASSAALDRQPLEAEKQREHGTALQTGRQTFETGQDKTRHGYEMQQIGAQGANALRVANVRHPDGTGPAQAEAKEREQNEVQDSLNLIKEIRNDSSLDAATGPFDGRGLGMLRGPEGYTRVKKHHDTLVNRMQLAMSHKLKGQGAVSNFEREILRNATTSLDRTLGTPDYKNELDKVEVAFQRLLTGPRTGAAPATAQGGSPAAAETPEQRIKRLLGGG